MNSNEDRFAHNAIRKNIVEKAWKTCCFYFCTNIDEFVYYNYLLGIICIPAEQMYIAIKRRSEKGVTTSGGPKHLAYIFYTHAICGYLGEYFIPIKMCNAVCWTK